MGFLDKILDILYPHSYICLNCGRKYMFSELENICDYCITYLELISSYCHNCGREMDSKEEICDFCQENSSGFDLARSLGIYDGLLKDILQKFKYEGCRKLSGTLAELLYIALKEYYFSEELDRIVPVPIHDKRLQERGYNQAELLARELALKTGIPLSTLIKRIKDNPPLYNYGYQQRKDLLENSFYVEEESFSGENILLVDDIFTTGATSSEISNLLKAVGGAERVLVITVATARVN